MLRGSSGATDGTLQPVRRDVGDDAVVRPEQHGPLLGRMLRAARLDPQVYAAVRTDRAATAQAAAAVALVGIAHGAATIVRALLMGWWSGVAIGVAFLFEVGLWLTVGSATLLIGRYAFGSAATYGQVLRPLGFACTPGLLILPAALLSRTGVLAPALVALALWRLTAVTVAASPALGLRPFASLASVALGLVAGLAGLGVGISLLWRVLGEV